MISLPVLLNFGIPLPLALGTNKFQASFGSVAAAWHYAKAGVVDLKKCMWGITCTLIGSLVGTRTVQWLDPALLGRAVPWLLGAIVIYSLCQPHVGNEERSPRMGAGLFHFGFGLVLGFYDGFFGPGVGSLWTIAYVLLQGHSFLRATGHTKVMNATSNLASLALFASAGQVLLPAGLTMACGQALGARIGARMVVKKGAHFVRPIFLVMVTLTVIRLIWINATR